MPLLLLFLSFFFVELGDEVPHPLAWCASCHVCSIHVSPHYVDPSFFVLFLEVFDLFAND